MICTSITPGQPDAEDIMLGVITAKPVSGRDKLIWPLQSSEQTLVELFSVIENELRDKHTNRIVYIKGDNVFIITVFDKREFCRF